MGIPVELKKCLFYIPLQYKIMLVQHFSQLPEGPLPSSTRFLENNKRKIKNDEPSFTVGLNLCWHWRDNWYSGSRVCPLSSYLLCLSFIYSSLLHFTLMPSRDAKHNSRNRRPPPTKPSLLLYATVRIYTVGKKWRSLNNGICNDTVCYTSTANYMYTPEIMGSFYASSLYVQGSMVIMSSQILPDVDLCVHQL